MDFIHYILLLKRIVILSGRLKLYGFMAHLAAFVSGSSNNYLPCRLHSGPTTMTSVCRTPKHRMQQLALHCLSILTYNKYISGYHQSVMYHMFAGIIITSFVLPEFICISVIIPGNNLPFVILQPDFLLCKF